MTGIMLDSEFDLGRFLLENYGKPALGFLENLILAIVVFVVGWKLVGYAARMLRLLAGRRHQVMTGVWCCSPALADGFTDTAEVSFFSMTEEEIAEYVASGEPMDKAGAYAIQGIGMRYIEGLQGDFYTVMGLPGGRLRRFLRKFREIAG